VNKVVAFLARLGFWPFIFWFTALAIVLSELLIMAQSYWLTGTFFDRNLLIVGFVTPMIDGFVILYLVALLIRYLGAIRNKLDTAKQKIQDANRRLEEAQEIAHMGFWELDLYKGRLYWSKEVYRIFGLEPEAFEPSYEAFLARVHPEDREVLTKEFRRSIDEKQRYSTVHRIIQQDGTVRYVEERCKHIYDSRGKATKSIGTVFDITDRIADRNKLQRLFDLQKNIVVQTDGTALRKVNQSFLHFFGVSTLEAFQAENGCICELFVKDDRFFHLDKVPKGQNWLQSVEALPKKDRVVSILDTKQRPHAFSISVNHFDDDSFIVSFADISETMLEQFSLKQKVSRDHLTGAFSRDFFETNIHTFIENARKRNAYLGLVMLDIDHFKIVNDTYGHDIGDKVLRHLVPTVKYSIRNDDMLIRWGGEEFLLIAETESAQTLRRMAEHVRQRIENEPFDVVGHITCSFGMTLYEENEPIEQAIKRADKALYEAKEKGRNKVAVKLL
jgi:diguanylate cyclase (GGDEF)-like protein/PAS domain S-box-containing protein